MSTHMPYVTMRHRKGYATPAQTIKFIKYFNQKAANSNNTHQAMTWKNKALLIYTLWHTGRRISEILGIPDQPHRAPGLRPVDIDPKNKEIDWYILKKLPVRKVTKAGNKKKKETILKEKFTKREYKVTLPHPKEFIDVLVNWCVTYEIPSFERIFPYNRIYVDRVIKEAARELGITLRGKKVITNPVTKQREEVPFQFSAHSFRHGFSINFLKKNNRDPAALAILQEILCHSNINVTKTYMRFDDSKHREMMRKAAGGKE